MTLNNPIIVKSVSFILDFIEYLRSKMHINILYLLKRFFISINTEVFFIIEDIDWAIYWVGKNVSNYLKKNNLIKIELDRRYFVKNKIIHFGSINCLLKQNKILKLEDSNKYILTIFHIAAENNFKKIITYLNCKIHIIHTSNQITKQKLIDLGFSKQKIIVIPLGVDLSLFKQYNEKLRVKLRKKYNLPQNKIIIGSFQKDGVGWGEGLKPKMIKGPDIFCETVKKLNEMFNIYIFLTGPARGYVKEKLKEYNIPYKHIFLSNYEDIVKCYNTLDLYLVTSRAEGGPLALLECMATGVPIVSTKVGMAPEIIENGFNGFITEINDINKLCEYSTNIINNKELKDKIIKNGLNTVKKFDWEKIANQYYLKLYKKFL